VRRQRICTLVLCSVVAAACNAGPPAEEMSAGTYIPVEPDDPQIAFWNNLLALCDNAYAGTVIEAPAGDTTFANKALIMHVRVCSEEEIRIPFHVGEDRSRVWVLMRDELGITLKHDHRHDDGREAERTWYGGQTRDMGTDMVQEFGADAQTAEMIPEAATNVWTIEVVPDDVFVYALRREGTDRRFRIEFDLTRSVSSPPPPWADRATR
jgi:hypothetical protein